VASVATWSGSRATGVLTRASIQVTQWKCRSLGLFFQPDGKLIVGGNPCRLNSDGSVDASFKLGKQTHGAPRFAAFQADGKIVLWGWMVDAPGYYLARLNSEGSVDAQFNPRLEAEAVGNVVSLAVQPDGKVLIAGGFTKVSGVPSDGLARLKADGGLDATFNPASKDWSVRLVTVLARRQNHGAGLSR